MKPICLRQLSIRVSYNSISNNRLRTYLVPLLIHHFCPGSFLQVFRFRWGLPKPIRNYLRSWSYSQFKPSDTVGRNPANHLGCKKPPTYYQLVQAEGRLLPVISRVLTPLQGVKKKNGYPVARPFIITSYRWRPSCSDVGPMMGVTLTPKMTMAKSLIVKLRKLHLLVMLPFSIANFYDFYLKCKEC